MAYGTISPLATDADSPITQDLMDTIRLNFDFLEPFHPNWTAGDFIQVESVLEVTDLNTSFTKVKEFKIAGAGAIRAVFAMRRDTTNTARGQVFRNGSPVGSEQVRSSSLYAIFTEDIAGWATGDLCQLYVKSSDGGQSVKVKNFSIMLANASPAGRNGVLEPGE